ncbi:MAG: DUF6776 family protein [Spongiibacteraceae bacterium]
MAKVTGSKQYRSIVVQDRTRFRRGLSLIFIVFVAVLSYFLGAYVSRGGHEQLVEDYSEQTERHEQLQQKLTSAEADLETLKQELVNSKVGADVDRQAVNELRSVISEHQQTITELNEEISFYKDLMAPTEREKGLGIRSWELYPSTSPRHFQFKLIVQQLALKHALLKGVVNVNIVGKRGDVDETLSLDILSPQVDSKGIKLQFKYFQYIEGELQLPVDFIPERIDVIAKQTSPKKIVVEKHYGWIVQNSPG